MIEIEIPLLPDTTPDEAETAIERAAGCEGLRISLKGTLARCPGCIHWHFKRGAEPGTLEATLWPAERRLWLSIHAGRAAPWVEAAAPALKQRVQGLV